MNKETANIYLIGMMGSGKSTIGEHVARELGMNFFDSDLEIEKKTGKSVNALFSDNGEEEFRSLEQVTLIDMEIFSDTGSIQVTWRVKKSKDRFFVIDLLVADISLVVTKRSEFNSMLKNVNYNLSEFNKKLLSQNESSYQKIIN